MSTDAGTPTDLASQEATAASLRYEFYVAGRGRMSRCLMSGACADPGDARAVANCLATVDLGVEVWLGDRLISSVPPKQPPPQGERRSVKLVENKPALEAPSPTRVMTLAQEDGGVVRLVEVPV